MKEFTSFLGFAEHLIMIGLQEKVLEHNALHHACVEIETRAKNKIGEYQSQTGPFAAWAELAESTKEQRVQLGYSDNEPGLRSGEMRDSIEHKVIGHEGHIGSDDDKLLWFELGTTKQPPRSVLGGAAFELGPKIAGEIGVEFAAWLAGGRARMKIE